MELAGNAQCWSASSSREGRISRIDSFSRPAAPFAKIGQRPMSKCRGRGTAQKASRNESLPLVGTRPRVSPFFFPFFLFLESFSFLFIFGLWLVKALFHPPITLKLPLLAGSSFRREREPERQGPPPCCHGQGCIDASPHLVASSRALLHHLPSPSPSIASLSIARSLARPIPLASREPDTVDIYSVHTLSFKPSSFRPFPSSPPLVLASCFGFGLQLPTHSSIPLPFCSLCI